MEASLLRGLLYRAREMKVEDTDYPTSRSSFLIGPGSVRMVFLSTAAGDGGVELAPPNAVSHIDGQGRMALVPVKWLR